jgi:VanZ family protein
LFCLPGSAIPPAGFLDKIHFDKFVHFALFFMLVHLMQKPLIYSQNKISVIFFFITLASMLYGIAIEFIQKHYIPNRSFDWGDVIADIIGCIVAYINSMRDRFKHLKK